MRPRKKIIKPKLSDYFHLERKKTSINNSLYFNTQIFNGFSFLTVFSAICIILGFYRSLYWSIGLSVLFLLFYLYQKCSKLCYGITIEREIPGYSVEKNELTVTYKVSNETGFRFSGLSFIEGFDGVQSGFFEVQSSNTIPPQTQVTIKQKIVLNGGMGIKKFEPIRLNIRDELGIFDFKVEFIQPQEIEVYPFLEETPSFKKSISPDSIENGLYELSKRGDSNLFMGTREYRRGDPVKHINWKLTKKSDKVIVNEFEKSTNTSVTLLLDLNLESQSGSGEISTWELTKDLALSICQNEINKSNSIQVISNDLYIPWGSGKKQIALFEKFFTHHELKTSKQEDFIRHLSAIPARGQVYYICPVYFSPQSTEIIEHLKKLKEQGQKVIVFAINPFKEMASIATGKNKSNLLEMHRHLVLNQERIRNELMIYGIPLIPISADKGIGLSQQIVQNSKDLLEIK